MLKAVTIAIASIGLAGAATMDTLAMQQHRETLVAERQEPLAKAPDPESLRTRLRTDPLEPEVLRDLGMHPSGGDSKLLQLAERVSRQDPVNQLLLLQSAAQSGDLDATLTHYDVLLSTRQKTTPALQAQLANGLQNAEIAAKVEQFASRRWFPYFLAAAATMSLDPRPVAALAEKTGQLSAGDDRFVTRLLTSLVSKGYPAEAFQLIHTATKHDQAWATFTVTPASVNPLLAPLTWTLTTGAQAHATFDGTGTVSIAIDPLTTAPILQRVTDLAPGIYSLKQTIAAPAAKGPSLEWHMTCLTSDLAPPQSSWQAKIRVPGWSAIEVAVPSGCPFQEWTLWAVGADTQTASIAEIKGVSLRAH